MKNESDKKTIKKKPGQRKNYPAIRMLLLCICILMISFFCHAENNIMYAGTIPELKDIPEYTGSPYVEINANKPFFTEEELTTDTFEKYSDLDELGRCGTAYACIGQEIMPTEERESIGEVEPSGWQLVNYHDLIDGNYLYNRCHLIAFALAGENANEKNLITGTRYMNVDGMQPFEFQILDYVRSTGNHVLYRVTPIFKGDNLLAEGVLMEGLSVEDQGKGVCFNAFAYNVQPGVIIDYKSGDNKLDPDYKKPEEKDSEDEGEDSSGVSKEEAIYVINTNTMKFHYPACESVRDTKEKNKKYSKEDRNKLIKDGYQPCGRCNP